MTPMRCVLAGVVALVPVAADAAPIVFDDATAVKQSTDSTWADRIGDRVFETSRITVDYQGDDLTIRLFTNIPTGGTVVGGRHFAMADLAFDLDGNGSFETGLAMTDHGNLSAGTLYEVEVWDTSLDLWGGTGFIVAGAYDDCVPGAPTCSTDQGAPPVRINAVAATLGIYGISTAADTDPEVDTDQVLTIDLSGVNFGGVWDEFGLLWGTATCANDTIHVVVDRGPQIAAIALPGTLPLLGFGTVGAALARRRRR